jgi:hypothetical protein
LFLICVHCSLIACAIHTQRISRSSSTAGHASTAAASEAELAFANSFHQRLVDSVLFEQQLKAQQDKQWDKILSKLDKVSKVSLRLENPQVNRKRGLGCPRMLVMFATFGPTMQSPLSTAACCILPRFLDLCYRLPVLPQALPVGSSSFSAANASKLSDWLTRNFDSTLSTALPSTHAFIIWTAALCRVWPGSVFKPCNQQLLIVAANTAAKQLQLCAAMCRLQAAGITFTAQLPAAAAAAAVELAALLLIDLAAEHHKDMQKAVAAAEQAKARGKKQPVVTNLMLPAAQRELTTQRPQLLLLCTTVLAIYGTRLQQQQQQQQVAAAAVAGRKQAAVAVASSSSSTTTTWQLAEALLLQRADNFQSTAALQRHQQLLARVLEKAHAQQAQDVGFSLAFINDITTHLQQGLVSPLSVAS